MDQRYFERLHREQARRAEWRLLDEALRTRCSSKHHPVRVLFGHWLIRVGAALADETVVAQPKPCCNRH
jgi:hypothetical protein